jgi:hypothetical protein
MVVKGHAEDGEPVMVGGLLIGWIGCDIVPVELPTLSMRLTALLSGSRGYTWPALRMYGTILGAITGLQMIELFPFLKEYICSLLEKASSNLLGWIHQGGPPSRHVKSLAFDSIKKPCEDFTYCTSATIPAKQTAEVFDTM